VAFLRDPQSHPGPIYVFAMPNLYDIAGRKPAVRYQAIWFRPTVALWQRLSRELDRAAPPYILVNDHELGFVLDQNSAVREEVLGVRARLARQYRVLRSDRNGTWYVRHDLARSPLRLPRDDKSDE
jgi:hypothetical protein